jgi:hypothetical protein
MGLARTLLTAGAVACICHLPDAFGAGNNDKVGPPGPVTITNAGPNVVTNWNEVATAVINLPPDAVGTSEERRPNYAVDLATVQVAVYDAVMAIARTHRPFAITPAAAGAGASEQAAAGEAAYRVLRGLFPSRIGRAQTAYERFVESIPDSPAKTQGLEVGAEVAAGVLALRASDGRSVALAPYAPGSAPGQYRGADPVGRMFPYTKPFALTSSSQFRAPGPPELSGAAYAADFNETRLLGATASTTRTAEQSEIARFHTELPSDFWPRNLRSFAMTSNSVAEQARLMAMLWVTHADATIACFESKYHFQSWRPLSAIPLAGTDGNDATAADPAWTPFVPTPPHPEYPAAHSCVAGALAETLRQYYGTSDVIFDFTSTVTGSTRHYTSVDGLIDEIQIARIAGGMHFRSSTVDGAALGKRVANWALSNNFQPR